jgi:hypothetical protein
MMKYLRERSILLIDGEEIHQNLLLVHINHNHQEREIEVKQEDSRLTSMRPNISILMILKKLRTQ